MGSPKAGNHNDLYEIEEVLKEILALLEEAGMMQDLIANLLESF